jgi:hypothetical protein
MQSEALLKKGRDAISSPLRLDGKESAVITADFYQRSLLQSFRSTDPGQL